MTTPEYFRCYADSAEIIQDLTDAQAGQLLKAKYAYMGTLKDPQFNDPTLRIIWKYEKTKMDRDFKALYITRVKAIYAAYCKKEKNAGSVPMSCYDWLRWQKEGPYGQEFPDPLFSLVNPEDVIDRKSSKHENEQIPFTDENDR